MKLKGYLLGIVAAAAYGLNPLFALPLYEEGMDPNSVLFYRYLFAIIIIAVMVLARNRDFKVQKKNLPSLSFLGLMMVISALTLFNSYKFMDVGIASTIFFIYPIIVAIIMTMFFKEKMDLLTLVCILLTMFGIGLLYKTDGGLTLNKFGILLVIISALSYSLYIVGVNHGNLKNIPTVKLTFYVLVLGEIMFFINAMFSTGLHFVNTPKVWINILGLAIFPTIVSYLCTTMAVKYIGSTPVAILGAVEPITAVIVGVCVFGEVLTRRAEIGILLIIVSVTIIIAGGEISKYLIRIRKLFPKLPYRKK